jgi:hypothetical protein
VLFCSFELVLHFSLVVYFINNLVKIYLPIVAHFFGFFMIKLDLGKNQVLIVQPTYNDGLGCLLFL